MMDLGNGRHQSPLWSAFRRMTGAAPLGLPVRAQTPDAPFRPETINTQKETQA